MRATYVLAAWVLVTWGTRIRNAVQDDEETMALVVPILLTVLAVIAIVRPQRWGPALAIGASLAWLVRVPVIVTGDHGAAFVVVHTALAAITWALAWWVLRAPRRATGSGTARRRLPSRTR